jgi:uncharacterized protein (TIGR00369 family)
MADGEGGGSRSRITEGEWAGWHCWSARDPFEALTGPYYSRLVEGAPVCAMRLESRHMNGLGGLHGGAMMTFADFALFALSSRPRGGVPAVTVNLSGDFLGSARVGERVEARGEVTKAGTSLVFVRGLVTAEAERRPVLSFTGVIKKLRAPA